MAVSLEEFIEISGAEVCGDRLIVGQMAERRFVGDLTEGVFSLNDEGKAIVADYEAKREAEKAEAAASKSKAKETK